MTAPSNQERFEGRPERVHPDIAPELVGNGTFDDGWQPGDPDPHNDDIKMRSSPEAPGIYIAPEIIEIDGLRITMKKAIDLGLMQEDT